MESPSWRCVLWRVVMTGRPRAWWVLVQVLHVSGVVYAEVHPVPIVEDRVMDGLDVMESREMVECGWGSCACCDWWCGCLLPLPGRWRRLPLRKCQIFSTPAGQASKSLLGSPLPTKKQRLASMLKSHMAVLCFVYVTSCLLSSVYTCTFITKEKSSYVDYSL